MTARIRGMLASAGVVLALGSSSVIAENIKIAFIDPLSGPFAPVGQNTFVTLSKVMARVLLVH